jgi:hypothetical protein
MKNIRAVFIPQTVAPAKVAKRLANGKPSTILLK